MGKKKIFNITPHTVADKTFAIEGPGITLLVDYDDVDHEEVEGRAQDVVHLLNKYWVE